jgi:hypothetical protein
MTDTPAILADIACDYLHALLGGEPIYAETVADNFGPARVSRGMATLLVFLACDAASETDTTPGQIVERLREKYARAEAVTP